MGRQTTKIDLSGTHLPVLSKLLRHTTGSVLELGAGFNSTPLLYWTCRLEKRTFESYENDPRWCEKMGSFTSLIKDWGKVDIDNDFWSIVFIDCRPALERHRLAIRMKDRTEFVVLHDSEPEIDRFYAYRRVYPHFKYRYDFTKLKPNTVVLSNFRDPRFILDSI